MKKMLLRGALIFIGIFLVFEGGLKSQQTTEMEFDLDNKTFKKNLPFDTPFLLKIKTKQDIKTIVLEWEDIGRKGGAKDSISCDKTPGSAEIVISMPPLKPITLYRFLFTFDIEPTPAEVKEVKDKIGEKIFNLLNEMYPRVKNHDDINEIVKKIENDLPGFVPGNYKGIKLTPKDSSVFYETKDENIRNAIWKDKRGKVQKLLDPVLEKKNIARYFNQIVPSLFNSLTELSEDKALNPILSFISDTGNADLNQGKALVEQILILRDRAGYIANGAQHIYYIKKAETEIPGIKNIENFLKPSDCEEQIVNYNKSLDEINILKIFLIRFKNVKGYNDFLLKNGLKDKDISNLSEKIGECEEMFWCALNTLDRLQKWFISINKIAQELLDEIGVDVKEEIIFQGSTSGDFKTRASWYISADLGIAYAPLLNEVFPYFGVNIYFRPVNKEVPLKLLRKFTYKGKPVIKSTFLHRFSAMVGISVASFAREGQRENLFGKSALLVGTGYRLSDSIRCSTGLVLYKALDPNPLILNQKTGITWFLSFSLDWDVRETLGDMLKLLTGGK